MQRQDPLSGNGGQPTYLWDVPSLHASTVVCRNSRKFGRFLSVRRVLLCLTMLQNSTCTPSTEDFSVMEAVEYLMANVILPLGLEIRSHTAQ
jgi:hypothetical protein